jgi:hypothetical protein
MRSFVLMLATLLCASVLGTCQVPPGLGAGAFATLGIHARPLGMGGAFAAMTSSQPIPYYNPAGLQWAERITAVGMYAEPFGQGLGISLQNFSVVARLGASTEDPVAEDLAPEVESDGQQPGWGVGLTWVGIRIDEIMLWDEDDPLSVESVSAGSNLLLASASMEIMSDWAVGGSIKLYHSHILQGRAIGVGLDLGLLGVVEIGGVPLTVGLNAMDVGRTRVRWRNTEGNPVNYVPWVNKFGVSAGLWEDKLTLLGDFDWAMGRPAREQKIHLGIELRPLTILAVRGGWKGDLEGQTGHALSGGLSLELLGRISLSYAYVTGAIGGTHFASVDISF